LLIPEEPSLTPTLKKALYEKLAALKDLDLVRKEQLEIYNARIVALKDVVATRDSLIEIYRHVVADLKEIQAEHLNSLKTVVTIQNQTIAGLTFCFICTNTPKDTALNCGHVMCAGCAAQVIACPCCRVLITKRRGLFL
jgi:putative ubiquitin-RnfH superfamily antitoxin RatB of RatAB toxin-antitoxin module